MKLVLPSKDIRLAAPDALRALDRFCPQIREKRKKIGGYLYVAFAEAPEVPVLVMYIGDEQEKHEKYLFFAREKCVRVAAHEDHSLSFQSRDDAEEKYQGSIKFEYMCVGGKKMVMGFSGMPAEADEAFCLLLAIMSGGTIESVALELANISNNETFRSVAKHINTIGALRNF